MTANNPLRTLLLSVAAITFSATGLLCASLAEDGLDGLDAILIVCFALLVSWVGFWCCIAAAGCWKLLRLPA